MTWQNRRTCFDSSAKPGLGVAEFGGEDPLAQHPVNKHRRPEEGQRSTMAGEDIKPPVIRVSGAEPAFFREIGPSSNLPERFGCDFLWRGPSGKLCGVQRKEFPCDFCNSLNDGRMTDLLPKMRRLQELGGFGALVIEGEPSWGDDGQLLDRWKDYSVHRFEAFLASIQLVYGLSYWITSGPEHTRALILALATWSVKKSHGSLRARPKAVGAWGKTSAQEELENFYQGLPGCGTTRAAALVNHFPEPAISWNVTIRQLCEVPGIGKNSATRWYLFLNRANGKGSL